MTQNNRIAKWDNLKLFLIFTAVLGHICDRCISAGGQQFKSLFVFIYLFHMPAFFFISGMFSKRAVNSKDYGKVWSFIKQLCVQSTSSPSFTSAMRLTAKS